jgi:hypothetical protein
MRALNAGYLLTPPYILGYARSISEAVSIAVPI